MDKIVHEERCKMFRPQNCSLVLICTNFCAQNHWLVLIAPHGLVYFFKKFQWVKFGSVRPAFSHDCHSLLALIGSQFQFWCGLHAFCNTKQWYVFTAFLLYNCFYLPWLNLTLHVSLDRFPLPSRSGVPSFFISICWFFHVMSCSQPQLSYAKMASRSKVVCGKNNFPSGFFVGA
jgi:hypothetical protein